jgi:hypothetical protein
VTKTQVAFLLSAIYVYERRPDGVSQAEVEAWYQLLHEVDFDDAKAVVTAHFSESDRPLSPSKIRAGVRVLSAARKPKEDTATRTRVPDADPDDPRAFIKALRNGHWEADPVPGKPPPEGIPLAAVGRNVPAVTAKEVNDDVPRPRRWWLSRRQRDRTEGSGMGQTEDQPLPE